MEPELPDSPKSPSRRQSHDPAGDKGGIWLRGVPLNLDNLVVNRSSRLERTLSEIFSSIDDIRADVHDFKTETSARFDGLHASHETMGFALGEILVSCEMSGATADSGLMPASGATADSGEGSRTSGKMLYGKQAVIACVEQRRNEVHQMYEELERTQMLVKSAVETAEVASAAIPRVDQCEQLARQTGDELRRLLHEHNAFSSFFGSEGAFTAGTLRQELALHRQNVEGLAEQTMNFEAKFQHQSENLDLNRKIEELQRLEAAFTATIQEQKAWTARRIQELTLRVDSQPAIVQQFTLSEMERSNANRIEVKLRGELRALEEKLDRFEQVLADLAVPTTRSSSPPKEQPLTSSKHEQMEVGGQISSDSSMLEMQTSNFNLDEYAYCTGNAKSVVETEEGNASRIENASLRAGIDGSPKSPPLQMIPSMDVRVRIKSRTGSQRVCDGLPRWLQEHRSAVLSSKGADMLAEGARGRRRPQSARPFSH